MSYHRLTFIFKFYENLSYIYEKFHQQLKLAPSSWSSQDRISDSLSELPKYFGSNLCRTSPDLGTGHCQVVQGADGPR